MSPTPGSGATSGVLGGTASASAPSAAASVHVTPRHNSHAPKATRASSTTPTTTTRSVDTPLKQKMHTKQTGTPFKPAHNGHGPAIFNIVESAASYFEGAHNHDMCADLSKSYTRYQFNIDLLNQIFDGGAVEETGDLLHGITDFERELSRSQLMRDIAHKTIKSDVKMQLEDVAELEKSFRELQDDVVPTEKPNWRILQRIDQADTPDKIDALERELKRDFAIGTENDQPPIKQQKVDNTLPRLANNKDFCVLSFKSV